MVFHFFHHTFPLSSVVEQNRLCGLLLKTFLVYSCNSFLLKFYELAFYLFFKSSLLNAKCIKFINFAWFSERTGLCGFSKNDNLSFLYQGEWRPCHWHIAPGWPTIQLCNSVACPVPSCIFLRNTSCFMATRHSATPTPLAGISDSSQTLQ